MTAILVMGNADYSILMSDRRLSVDGKLIDDESNKAGVFVNADARMSFSFTGLAKYGNFKTHDWLVKTLRDCSSPEFLTQHTFSRLEEKLTYQFNHHQDLVSLPKSKKRLQVVFCGFAGTIHGDSLLIYTISNFVDQENKIIHNEAQESFESSLGQYFVSDIHDPLICLYGTVPLFESKLVSEIDGLLRDNKPAISVVTKGLELIHALSDIKSEIGKQVSSSIIPVNPSDTPSLQYHSNVNSKQSYYPSLVVSTSDKQNFVLRDPLLLVDEDGAPMYTSVPKTNMNYPCTCNSGKKFKDCHGYIFSHGIPEV